MEAFYQRVGENRFVATEHTRVRGGPAPGRVCAWPA